MHPRRVRAVVPPDAVTGRSDFDSALPSKANVDIRGVTPADHSRLPRQEDAESGFDPWRQPHGRVRGPWVDDRHLPPAIDAGRTGGQLVEGGLNFVGSHHDGLPEIHGRLCDRPAIDERRTGCACHLTTPSSTDSWTENQA